MTDTKTQTTDLFDLAVSRQARDMGIEAVSSFPASDWVAKAKSVALMLAAKFGEVDSDLLLQVCPKPPELSPNCVGAVFRCKNLVLTGYKQSSKVSSHARRIGIYSLR